MNLRSLGNIRQVYYSLYSLLITIYSLLFACNLLFLNILNLKIPPPEKSRKGFENNLHSAIANV